MLNKPQPARGTSQSVEPACAPEKTKSKGEKVFDWLTYGGLAWVGAFIATVPFAHYLSFGKGQWLHKGFSKWTEKGINLLRSGRNNAPVAEQVAMTTSLMMGGNAMLIPVGTAEHFKVPIVEKLNRLLGDNTPPEQIEKAPKQTWASLIEGRLVAWGAVFAAFWTANKLVPNTFATFKDEVGKLACKAMNKPVERSIAGKTVHSTTYRYGSLGALDFFAVTAAATLLYVGGHFFARKQAEKKTDKLEYRHVARHDMQVVTDETPTVVATQVAGEKQHQGMMKEPTREAQLSS